MNRDFADTKRLFENAGITDFSKLPEDIAEKRQFSKLFRDLNQHLEPVKAQGFIWEELTYEFDVEDGTKETCTLDFDKQVYDTLLQRYKELRRGGTGSGDEDEAYDIDSYLMALSTEKIDSDYMDSRFKKRIF